MITQQGYSNDSSIMPEGIVITWSRDMMNLKGGMLSFVRYFNKVMQDENCTWLQKCKNAPRIDVIHVYIIIANRLYGRCPYGGHQTGPAVINQGDGYSFSRSIAISWPRIVLGSPFEKCPFKKELKGFQGFRYCTSLF